MVPTTVNEIAPTATATLDRRGSEDGWSNEPIPMRYVASAAGNVTMNTKE